jgi:hypothetical protein
MLLFFEIYEGRDNMEKREYVSPEVVNQPMITFEDLADAKSGMGSCKVTYK